MHESELDLCVLVSINLSSEELKLRFTLSELFLTIH